MPEVSKLREDPPPASPPVQPGPTVANQARPQARRARLRVTRGLLLGLVPLLVVAAALYAYLHAGRYVSTDNAYVKAHIVNIAAEVSGAIAQVQVEENDRVSAGTTLFQLKPEAFRIAVARAEAALAQAGSDVNADKLAYQQALAEIQLHQATAEFARTQYARQVGLRAANLGTSQDLDTAKYALDSALQQIEVAQQQAQTLLARLHGDANAPVEDHPRYRQARAEYDQALLDLDRAVIRAPFAGIITNRPELGGYVEKGMPVMAVVADEGTWIEANFKETQFTYIRPDQPATIKIDSYPGQVWQGRLQSISEATGAEFSLLPPQNATGNWVKIVQRIPVRVAIETTDDLPPLRVGMSCTVTIDTGHTRSWRELLPAW